MNDLEITNEKTLLAYTKGIGVPEEVCKRLCMAASVVECSPTDKSFLSWIGIVQGKRKNLIDLTNGWFLKFKVHPHHVEFKELIPPKNE